MSVDSGSDNNSENSDRTEVKDHDSDICRDFLRNVCKRGKRCKFRHPNASEANIIGKKQEYTFCHDFQNSGCRRPTCKFIHCTREEEEYHKQTGQLPVRLQQAAALGIGVIPNETPLLNGEVPICKDFLKGECKRAGRCKYRHLKASEYEYELRRSERRKRGAELESYRTDDFTETYTDYKRRKLSPFSESAFTHNNNYESLSSSSVRTNVDFHLLEEENALLRRKVEELKKQVSDLVATNEVLLEQNARFRSTKVTTVTAGPPIVTVSQVVTPTITPAPTVARPALITMLNTCTTLPQLTLNANSELIMSHAQALQPRLSLGLPPELTELRAQQPDITQASITPNPQAIVPVSLPPPDLMAAPPPVSMASMASASLPQAAQASLPQAQNIISAQNTGMVSYPIMSHTHTQITNTLGVQ